MIFWIGVAVIGGVLSIWGLWVFWGRYRRGEITGRYLLAVFVGFVSYASFALLSAVRPELSSGPVALAVLLPAFLAILVLIREHRKAEEHK